jgi:hypothetical protein
MGVGNLAFGGAVRSAWNGREVSGPDGTTVMQPWQVGHYLCLSLQVLCTQDT